MKTLIVDIGKGCLIVGCLILFWISIIPVAFLMYLEKIIRFVLKNESGSQILFWFERFGVWIEHLSFPERHMPPDAQSESLVKAAFWEVMEAQRIAKQARETHLSYPDQDTLDAMKRAERFYETALARWHEIKAEAEASGDYSHMN